MNRRRVVITGAGTINALGNGVAAFLEGLRSGRSGIGELTAFDSRGFRTKYAAQVNDLRAPHWIPAALRRRASRSDMLALHATREALTTASFPALPDDAGIVIGATTGGMFGGEEYFRRKFLDQARTRRSNILATPVSTTVDLLAQLLECGGPRLTVSTACSSGANALGIAADWIRTGVTPVVLCGGSDSLCRMTFSGFNALQALDPAPCRPFDRRRAGLTLGEGSAMFVFEDAEHAAARGAKPLAEFLGYGISADAHHITQPRPDGAGAELATRRALEDSGVGIEEIDYINAHGTATVLNDVIETRALHAVFGVRAAKIPVSSTKSMIGHCLGAAGALEALAGILAIRESFVPPTIGLEEADPECDLDYVTEGARSAKVRSVLSNSYGFGGNNTCIILRAID